MFYGGFGSCYSCSELAAGRGAGHEALAVVLDLGFGQRVEMGDDLGPRACSAERGDAVIQRLLEHEGEEVAEGRAWSHPARGWNLTLGARV